MINIFNPAKVFKDELSASWASNIKTTRKGSQKISIDKTGTPPVLVLEALPEVEYFIGVLPLNRNWKAVDLTEYKHIKFNITTSKTEYPEVDIQLVSGENDEEVDSDSISLSEYGLMEECEQEFIIPIEEFTGDGYNIHNVKTIKIIGCGNFNMKLSGVVIE
jgi:hypothetical protein